MTLLTAALVLMVFKYKVTTESENQFSRPDTTLSANDAYYVHADSTMLVFLASWMSSLAPLLAGCAISLAAYPIAQKLFEDTLSTSQERLPTPFQFAIALKFINGSTWSAIWDLLLYRFRRRSQTVQRCAALEALTSVTVTTLLLGFLVFGADTWLHITTSTINSPRASDMNSEHVTYSLSLLPDCVTTNNSMAALNNTDTSCTLTPVFSSIAELDTFAFADSVTTLETLNNQSQTRSVSYAPEHNISYLRVAQVQIDQSLDFMASTFGAQSRCAPISNECNLNISIANTTFSCNDEAFSSAGLDLGSLGLQRQLFRTADMSDADDPSQRYGVPNPFHVAVASYNLVSVKPVTDIADDPNIVAFGGAIAGVFMCEVTVVDIEHTTVAGTPGNFSIHNSNNSVTNLFASGIAGTPFGTSNMQAAMGVAASVAVNAQEMADRLALSLNNAVLSSGAGSVQRAPVSVAQRRWDLLVAKVPKLPLFLLITANICFVVMGLVLTTFAMRTSVEGREAQRRLTIAGIVANLFEGGNAREYAGTVEKLFGEYQDKPETIKVGIDRTSKGGFVFSSVLSSTDDVLTRENSLLGGVEGNSTYSLSAPYHLPEEVDARSWRKKPRKQRSPGHLIQ